MSKSTLKKIGDIAENLKDVVPVLRALDPGVGGVLLENAIEIIGEEKLGHPVKRVGQEGQWPDVIVDNTPISLKITKESSDLLNLTSAYKPLFGRSEEERRDKFIDSVSRIIDMIRETDFVWIIHDREDGFTSRVYDSYILADQLDECLSKAIQHENNGLIRFSNTTSSLLDDRLRGRGGSEGVAVLYYDGSFGTWKLKLKNNPNLDKSLVREDRVVYSSQAKTMTQKELVRLLIKYIIHNRD